MPPLLGLLLSVALGALAQVLLKLGVAQGGYTLSLPYILGILTRPQILFGISCFVVSFFLWLRVLAVYELSYAYPLVSLGYVLVTLSSWLFLGESLPPSRIVGLVFILLGIILVGRS